MVRATARRTGPALILAALGLLLALPAATLAAKPAASQSASLSFVGCDARVVADWANQPGRYKTYVVGLFNDVNGTQYHAAEGSARSGHVDTVLRLRSDTAKNFIVRLWFFDRDGAVVNSAASAWVTADCS